jgi:6-pyruvoyltetrahydropterin/6-carboxytetrahydropterin synthase
MYEVTRELSFCYGHRLLQYEGKCAWLHGHNGTAVLTLAAADLDALGMVADFQVIRARLGGWIDAELDHRMILRRDDPLVRCLQSLGEPVYLLESNPTVERIARLVYDISREQGLPVVRVTVWETPTSWATYSKKDA